MYYKGDISTSAKPEPAIFYKPVLPLLLFLGEAPGECEDITGKPLVGESGRIFNLMLSLCKTTFCFETTNVLGCRPAKYGKYGKVQNRTPTQDEIEQCQPRVTSLIEEVDYAGVVYLGNVAAKHPVERAIPTLKLIHPTFILRKEYKLYLLKEQALKLDNYVTDNFNKKQGGSNR